MSSLIKTLNVFPTERVVVERERSKRSYAVAPYFISKLIAESPIGAMFPLLFGSIVYPAAGLHQRASRSIVKLPRNSLTSSCQRLLPHIVLE